MHYPSNDSRHKAVDVNPELLQPCLHWKGDRQVQLLYTWIRLGKEKRKNSWRLDKVIQSLLSAEQELEQNEMRRDQVIFVDRSKPKT